jgi:DNA polymerase, archaea type
LHGDWPLFGWDATPGIVSVWAGRNGRALVWRRVEGTLLVEQARFRPWVLARSLRDVQHLGAGLAAASTLGAERARVTYRELSGPDDAYRFLLASHSWAVLEGAILRGAQRNNPDARSLHALGASYYRVGFVEQYLMQTGRVYFRDLTYPDLHRLQFDLETTALDPAEGRIFLVAVRDSRGCEAVLEAPTAHDEPRLIAELCDLIRARDPDVIENHNLLGFDLPFLLARAAHHRIPLALGRAPGPRGVEQTEEPAPWSGGRRRTRYSIAGRELLDTLDAVRRHDFVTRDLPSYGLKDVARAYGLAAPGRVYLEGAAVAATYASDPVQVRAYALQDVAEVDALSRRLHVAPFALAQMAPRRYERLATAGPAMGILEPLLIRAYLHAGCAPPCQAAGDGLEPHAGGGLHLFATGVAQRIVKADIASLYPSIMRAYRIGPQCDRLGALLYMGAGSMALFADRRAADEVTRRGRELLSQVVMGLRAGGVTLIEADTDGVYMAVPADWREADERQLVADVAATLPQGIRLEYEGRYAAMFSHTVKNYALLRYDGTLIVRGAALKSVRAEPFGERFLHLALERLLHDDVAGLVAAYAATVAALRERALPTSEIAVRARLAKTPEAYAATRATHREGVYEAMLAAGREQWSAGERVSIYRARAGWRLLPPSDEADARDYDVEHYLGVLLQSYVGRLRAAFLPAEFDQLFRREGQLGLFDVPLDSIRPRLLPADLA